MYIMTNDLEENACPEWNSNPVLVYTRYEDSNQDIVDRVLSFFNVKIPYRLQTLFKTKIIVFIYPSFCEYEISTPNTIMREKIVFLMIIPSFFFTQTLKFQTLQAWKMSVLKFTTFSRPSGNPVLPMPQVNRQTQPGQCVYRYNHRIGTLQIVM